MSWLSKGLKKIGKAWEKVDDYVLPAAGFLVGGPAGAAVGSAAARGIGDGKFDAGATLGAGVKGYAMGQMAGGIPGIGSLGGGGGAAASQAAGAAGGAGGIGGTLKSIGSWAANNPDLILSGVGMVQGAQQQGKANKMNERALALAEQPWKETAGLRSIALDRLQNPERVDLSQIYANNSNPFSRR